MERMYHYRNAIENALNEVELPVIRKELEDDIVWYHLPIQTEVLEGQDVVAILDENTGKVRILSMILEGVQEEYVEEMLSIISDNANVFSFVSITIDDENDVIMACDFLLLTDGDESGQIFMRYVQLLLTAIEAVVDSITGEYESLKDEDWEG